MAKAKSTATSFTIKFEKEKDTPGTHKFREVGEKATHKVGSLYVQKGAIDPNCQALSVTITTE